MISGTSLPSWNKCTFDVVDLLLFLIEDDSDYIKSHFKVSVVFFHIHVSRFDHMRLFRSGNCFCGIPKKVTVSGLSATTAEDAVTFNNLAAGTTVAMTDATDLNVTANFVTAATSGTADSVSVALNGVGSTAADDTTLTVSAGFETFSHVTLSK